MHTALHASISVPVSVVSVSSASIGSDGAPKQNGLRGQNKIIFDAPPIFYLLTYIAVLYLYVIYN